MPKFSKDFLIIYFNYKIIISVSDFVGADVCYDATASFGDTVSLNCSVSCIWYHHGAVLETKKDVYTISENNKSLTVIKIGKSLADSQPGTP